MRAEREPTAGERRWAWVRLALGIAQMQGAILGVVLLYETGLSVPTFVVAGATTSLTVLSRCLFRGGRP